MDRSHFSRIWEPTAPSTPSRIYPGIDPNIWNEEPSRIRMSATAVLEELRSRDQELRLTIDNLQEQYDNIDKNADECTLRVRETVERVHKMLEAREIECYMEIDQARQQKKTLIREQMDNLSGSIARLTDSVEQMRLTVMDNDLNHLTIMNARVRQELYESEKFCTAPCESSIFEFSPNETPMKMYKDVSNLVGTLSIPCRPLMQSNVLTCRPAIDMHAPFDDYPFPGALARPIYGSEHIVRIIRYGSEPIKVWGKMGSNKGELSRPWGITTNKMGQIIIADRANHRIQVLDAQYNYLFHFGTHGSGKGQLNKPSSVAVNPVGDMVVVDKDNHRIQVFNPTGGYLFMFGEKGTCSGQFQYPWDAAVDSAGNIYVSDSLNHRIQMFRWNGIFVQHWGGDVNFDCVPTCFESPRGVALDPNGNILVTDFNAHQVFVIDVKDHVIRAFGSRGSKTGQFERPQGICCDERGYFAVADSRNNRVQVFNNKGHFMFELGRKGRKRPGEFERTGGLFVDPEGHLHVVDLDNERVQVF